MIFIIINSCTYRPCSRYSSFSGGFGSRLLSESGFRIQVFDDHKFKNSIFLYRVQYKTNDNIFSSQYPDSRESISSSKCKNFTFFQIFCGLYLSSMIRISQTLLNWDLIRIRNRGLMKCKIKDNDETETKRSLDVLKTEAKRLRLWNDVYGIEAMRLLYGAMSMKQRPLDYVYGAMSMKQRP